MDFQFTNDQNQFRQEVRDFLDAELPPGWVDYTGTNVDDSVVDVEDGWQLFKDMARKLGNKGWLSLHWPKEYGGSALSNIDYLIFLEEIARRGSPGFNAIGVKMLAPTLIDYGTEMQKDRHLKHIARGEVFWCEGFSEPEAGSDLASLRTKAIRDGDYFICNGQKTWTTLASYADWCCLLARTDPYSRRHNGISFILVDLSTPGITIRPIENLLGEPHFSEIYFDDVKIPVENMVGAVNDGWRIAQTLLKYERVHIAQIAVIQVMIERLVKHLKTIPTAQRQNSRNILADLAIEAEIGRLLSYQIAWLQDHGMATEWHAAMSRLYSNRLLKRAASEALQILGLHGQLDKRDCRAPAYGWFEHLYLSALGATISAGTSEIQKTVIALRGLGMPKG